MWGRWARFRALRIDEKRLLAVALVWLPIVQVGLRLLGYQRMRQLLSRLGTNMSTPPEANRQPDAMTIEVAQRVGRIVNIAAGRRALHATCLARSLLTWWLLHRQGVAGTMVFGVPVSGGSFAAHAWVEVAGMVVNDAPDVRDRFGELEAANLPG